MVNARSPVFPKKLAPGDTVAIISPAAPTREPADAFEQGVALLEAQGLTVKLMPNAKTAQGYLAGNDAERLADLHAAFADPAVKAILCARGGYGCMRLLPNIDWDLIRANPKILIGFSDVTALLNPIFERTGLVGFYGPMLTSNLINGEPFSLEQLLGMVCGKASLKRPLANLDTYQCYQAGLAEAPLVGGNLSLLTALCGTPYQPETRGKLLFIEDWREQYYTLDRQFTQLKLAGLLDNIAGLLLCDFSEITELPDWPFEAFFRQLISDLKLPKFIPVGYGFSVGHGAQSGTLPIGIISRFDGTTGHITLMEQPVC